MAIDITLDDVITTLDGGACILKRILGKENREKLDQYYSLRARYCRARFNEKYAGEPAINIDVPPSIVEFWNTCDANIQKLVHAANLNFEAFNVKGTDPLHDLDFTIDAIGSVGGVDHAIMLLCFSGSWRSRNAVKLVAQLKMLERDNTTPPEDHALVALLLGKEEDKVEKLYRFIPKETTYTKTGKVKNEGWNVLNDKFNDAVAETMRLFADNAEKDHGDIETNPAPINCATCPFHNTVIDDANGEMTCTGYYRPV